MKEDNEKISIMNAIKKFIEKCPTLENGKIKVDYLGEEVGSYSIDRTPSTPVIDKDIIGGQYKQITFDFVFQAPLSSSVIINLANSKFCEDFMDWIEKQNKNKIYPDIIGVQEISCTSPGYILQKTNTTAIYIIQMRCVYYER